MRSSSHEQISEQVVLKCEKCEEKLILLGSEDEWRSRRAVLQCGCGQKIVLDRGHADEEALAAS